MQVRVCRFFYFVLAMAFIFFFATTGVTYAQDFNGGYIGGTVGMSHYNLELNDNDLTFDGISADGPNFGIIGGFGKNIKNNMYVGFEGNFGYNTAEVEISTANDNIELEAEDSFGFSGRIGHIVNSWMTYGLVGWQQVSMEASVNNVSDDEDFNGFRLGIGVEHQIQKEIFLRGEYSCTMYNEEHNFEPTAGNFQLGLGFRF